jgi:hypothetical protein
VEKHVVETFHFAFMSKINFFSKRQFPQEILLGLVEKTSQEYVFLALEDCFLATTNFDLWMSKGACDVFALVINFLNNDSQPKHVTIGLFEVRETTGQTLVRNQTKLWDKYGLKKRIIVDVKDEGSNLNAMIIALKIVMNYESLGLEESF